MQDTSCPDVLHPRAGNGDGPLHRRGHPFIERAPTRVAGQCGMPSRAQVPLTTRQETEMPKMKTKASAKKRFKVTATGKIKSAQAGKRHGMIKRTTKFIRDARGTMVLSDPDTKIVKTYMPYDR